MADEIKRYPPTERRLERLRGLGVVPVSRALVGAAVLICAWLLLLEAGPALVEGCARALVGSLEIASTARELEDARAAIEGLAVQSATMVATVSLVCLAAAALVTRAQLLAWGRSMGGPIGGRMPAGGGSAPGLTPSAAEVGWLAVIAGVALLAIVLAARGALSYGAELIAAEPARLLETAGAVARAVGWRVLATLAGFGLLDYLMQRAAVWRAAWMSRRELNEEARQTEGHPLTAARRQRRMLRRPRHA